MCIIQLWLHTERERGHMGEILTVLIVSLKLSWRSNVHGCHVTSKLGWAFRLSSVNNFSIYWNHQESTALLFFVDRN